MDGAGVGGFRGGGDDGDGRGQEEAGEEAYHGCGLLLVVAVGFEFASSFFGFFQRGLVQNGSPQDSYSSGHLLVVIKVYLYEGCAASKGMMYCE